ncbi:hypothetical protein [Brucella intermedia]|uniref:hypothetical protein n=1 Tax=Brucella intermedia TaxID=94625 RepID=UPI00224A6871|nr:hypothetical protein [Brucella intermedia]
MVDTVSVRQQILNRMKDAYLAVKPPEWPIEFSTVELGPLSGEDHRKRYSLGIVAGPEKERFTYPYIECNFQVGVEFRITVNKGDPKPAEMAEQVLTIVKRVIDVNRNWGGLAVDTKRIGNDIDLNSYIDKSVVGVMFIEVMFRHSTEDPRSPQPAFR